MRQLPGGKLMQRLVSKAGRIACIIVAALLALAGCFHYKAGVLQPTRLPETADPVTSLPTSTPTPTPTPTSTPTRTPTPGPSPIPTPTLCAHARISGQTCVAHAKVRIESCCPTWYAEGLADEVGAFEFDDITAGEYTVSADGRSWEVVIEDCYGQASVNLCPPPTHPPLSR
jgi:hypothetical protein